MGKPNPTPARRRRGSLQPADIVAAALVIVEEHGLAGLTMPAVARAVGAAVTSVYWHFRTREDLVAAVAQRATSDLYAALPPVTRGDTWNDELFTYFVAFRQHLLAHPAFLELFTSRSISLYADPTIGALVNERLEHELEVLVGAGASPEDAYRVYNTLSTYTRGFVAIELARTREQAPAQIVQMGVGRQQALDPERYPVLSAIPDLASLTWDEAGLHFQDGLRLVINGITTELERSTSTRARTRTTPDQASRRAGAANKRTSRRAVRPRGSS
jgi:AcrR family transcriptional regulator